MRMALEKRSFPWLVLVVAVLAGFQNCSSGAQFEGTPGAIEIPVVPGASNVSGNGGTYDGKVRVLHHYVANFTCEGKEEPESILIRKDGTNWLLVQNTPSRCRTLNEVPVSGVTYDDVTKVGQYGGNTYVPPKPYFVQVVTDPNTPDVDLFDGVCEDSQGKCSLRAAAQQASATTSTASVIVNVPAASYVLSSPLLIQFLSSANSITVRGADASNTIIDGARAMSQFRIQGRAAPIYFEKLSFINGSNSAPQQASSLWVETLNVNSYGGPVNVTSCVFKNNSGNPPIYNVVTSGPTTIRKTLIDSNDSFGVETGGNSFTIEDTTISNNNGAGIMTGGAYSTFVIRNSSILGNSGPGMSLTNCYNCLLENVTVANNQIHGLQIFTSINNTPTFDLNIRNSTFYHNGVGSGSALNLSFNDAANRVILSNSILAMADSSRSDCSWPGFGFHTILATNSIFDDTSCGAIGSGNLTADPKLAPLGMAGGLTAVFVPMLGSPAVDGGETATCLARDQRGLPRPIDKLGQGAKCDIGSVEVQ